MKSLSIISFAICFLWSPITCDSQHVPSQDSELASTVKEFFTTWLVNRDVKTATKYISEAPVIGKCAVPDDLDKQDQLPRKVIVDVFQQLFTNGLDAVPQKHQLSDLIEAPGYISSKDRNTIIIDHSTKRYFEIFRLNLKDQGKDIRYICKFDERKSFREAVSQPDVYYVVTRVKLPNQRMMSSLNFFGLKKEIHGKF